MSGSPLGFKESDSVIVSDNGLNQILTFARNKISTLLSSDSVSSQNRSHGATCFFFFCVCVLSISLTLLSGSILELTSFSVAGRIFVYSCLLIYSLTDLPLTKLYYDFSKIAKSNVVKAFIVTKRSRNPGRGGGGGTLEMCGWGCAAGTLEPLAYT